MIEPLIAIDLGARPACGLITGTEGRPVLIEARRFPRFEGGPFVGILEAWLERWPRAEVWCEATFSQRGAKRAYLADVGRLQEGQAGLIEGMLGRELLRVPPCSGTEAQLAWGIFGRPEEGRGPAGEHVRDMLAVGLKALIRRGERMRARAGRSGGDGR